MLAAWRQLRQQTAAFDKAVRLLVKSNPTCRHLMSVPGIGVVSVLACTADAFLTRARVRCAAQNRFGRRKRIMSGSVTFARINHDGTLIHVASDGSEEARPAEPIAPLMPEQVKEAVPQGPDAQPLSAENAQPIHLTPPHVASLRRALFLTQKEFAARYHISLAALRDWEREHSQPDQPMCAYLAVIARHPEIVRRALQRRARVDRRRAQTT
jgi:putative transcriptional regulator